MFELPPDYEDLDVAVREDRTVVVTYEDSKQGAATGYRGGGPRGLKPGHLF